VTNCPLCGVRLSVEARRDRKDTIIFPNAVEVVICENCGSKKTALAERLKGASLSQMKILITKDNASLVDAILRERRLTEQSTPTGPKKDEHGCIIGVEEWNEDLHQCTKIEFEKPKCPPGTVWNPDLHQCVKITKYLHQLTE